MKLYRLYSICVAITMLLTCMFAGVGLADEPNDTPETADHLLIGLEHGITADLTADDTDYYSFTASAGDSFVFSTYDIRNTDSADNNATSIWLYDSQQTLLKDDRYGSNGTGNVNATVLHNFTQEGVYYLAVRSEQSRDWEGEYSIRALRLNDPDRLNWNVDDQFSFEEPNSPYLGLAYPVEVGYSNAITTTLYDGSQFASINSDRDIYSFYGKAGVTYVIQTYDVVNSDPTNNNATGIRLYDSSGAELRNDDLGRGGHGNVNAQIIYRINVDGFYYVSVAKYSSASSSTNWTGDYSFRILTGHLQPEFGQDAETFEPNDACAIATTIPFSREGIYSSISDHTGWVSTNADVDYYTFEVEDGESFIVQTFDIINNSADDNRATSVWLYDSECEWVTDDRYGSNGRGNVNAQVANNNSVGGRYYIAVTHWQNSEWQGNYGIRVMKTFTADGETWDSDTLEPNDTFGLAYPIPVGNEGITTGLISDPAWVSQGEDQDIYVFDGVENETYIVQTLNIINTDATDNNATGIYLYDQDGNEISVNDYTGRFGHNNVNAQVAFQPSSSGKIYIQVISDLSWTGEYTVRVLPSHVTGDLQHDGMQEPNDAFALAYPLSVSPSGVTSSIDNDPKWVSNRYDSDYFVFQAETGTEYKIRTYGINNYDNAGNATGVWLYAYDGSEWIELANDRYGSNGEGDVNAEITHEFTVAGAYYVVVAADNGFTSSNDWDGAYSVCVVETGTACEVVPLAVTVRENVALTSLTLVLTSTLLLGLVGASVLATNKRHRQN